MVPLNNPNAFCPAAGLPSVPGGGPVLLELGESQAMRPSGGRGDAVGVSPPHRRAVRVLSWEPAGVVDEAVLGPRRWLHDSTRRHHQSGQQRCQCEAGGDE